MQGAWGWGWEARNSWEAIRSNSGAGIVLLILQVPVTGGPGCTWGGINRTPGLHSMEPHLSPSSLGELSQCEPQPEPALTSAIFVCGLNKLHPADDPGSHCSWRTTLSRSPLGSAVNLGCCRSSNCTHCRGLLVPSLED